MLPLGGFFQLGYVTTDLEQAIDLYAKRFGAPNFLTFDTAEKNPNGKFASLVALAWIGSTQVELIQPKNAEHPLYGDALPRRGFGVNLHHLGYNLENEAQWTSALNDLACQDIRIASHTMVKGVLELVYADTRHLLGHYIEYVWRQPEGWRSLREDVPRNGGPTA